MYFLHVLLYSKNSNGASKWIHESLFHLILKVLLEDIQPIYLYDVRG